MVNRLYRNRLFPLSLAILLMLSGTVLAENWSQWRGPNRDGISPATGLLQQWPEGGPKLLWHAQDLGDGYGSPSVVDGQLYVLTNVGLDDEFVKALDVKDGSVIWSTRIGKVGNPDQRPNYPASRTTPTVVGEVLYALGSDGDLVCLKTTDGEAVWKKNLRSDFGGEPGVWAYSESPLVDGDLVVVTPGGDQATIVALNRETGETVWKSAVPGNQAAYASLVVAETDGVKQYVAYLSDQLVGVDASNGELLWKYNKTKGQANMATPVVHRNFVFSGTSRTGGALVKLSAEDDSVSASEVYFDTHLPTGLGGAVLVGDYLYGSGRQTLMCVNFKTGEVQWEDRSIAPGSICIADGCIYLHGENGRVALVKATPEEYRELGSFTPPNPPDRGNAKAWAYPMVANGCLYIRQAGSIWCYEISAKE